MKKQRLVNIELLRVISMALIVACHVASNLFLAHHLVGEGGVESAVYKLIYEFGQVGVIIFFLITGYFDSKKEIKKTKAVNSWLVVLLYSLIIFGSTLICNLLSRGAIMTETFSGQRIADMILTSAFPILSSAYWFMTAYVLLLLIEPILNLIIEHASKSQLKYIIVLLLLLSLWPLLGYRVDFFSMIVYAITCYLIGASINKYSHNYNKVMQHKVLIYFGIAMMTLLLFVFNYLVSRGGFVVGTLHWNLFDQGPKAMLILISVGIFLLVLKSNKVTEFYKKFPKLNQLTLTLASTTLGIYLLHDHPIIRDNLWNWLNANLPGIGGVSMRLIWCVLLGVTIFVICTVAAYLINRFIVSPLTKTIINFINHKSHNSFDKKLIS